MKNQRPKSVQVAVWNLSQFAWMTEVIVGRFSAIKLLWKKTCLMNAFFIKVVSILTRCLNHISFTDNIAKNINVFSCFLEKLYKLHKKSFHEMKFSIKDFFSKCDQIRSFKRIWSHLLKKSLIENFIFCAVTITNRASNSMKCNKS